MKQILNFLIGTLLLSMFFSCTDESLLDKDMAEMSRDLSVRGDDTIQTFGACYSCLPSISATHDKYSNELVISWSGFKESPANHPVTLEYKIDGVVRVRSITTPNGSVREYINSENYLCQWFVKCSNYNCSTCTKSGSFLKKASGEVVAGSYNDCHKDFFRYFVENQGLGNYDLVIELYDGSGAYYDTDNYMRIESVHFFKENTTQEISYGGSLNKSNPDRLRLHLDKLDLYTTYEARFYGSACKSNEEHYYVLRFYYDGRDVVADSTLSLVKRH